MSETRRIAKNTVLLYTRMFVSMGVSLFTVGIVLSTLGISDYGIYSVVGGFISLFGFFNASMSSATQRFLAYDIGKNDFEKLLKTFSSTLTIHIGIAIIVLLVAETFGLWYINHRLNLPDDRMDVVNYVYQFSIASFLLTILRVPYNALLIARERFSIYTYVSFLELALKLITVLILVKVSRDKLVLYSFLTFFSSFIVVGTYFAYCYIKFKESRYVIYYDKKYFGILLSYSGWNLFGSIASIAKGQGGNLILNWFFGTAMNAAYGITSQFQGVVQTFVSNFQTAVNPQIVKLYAAGQTDRSVKLIQQSSRFSFGLMALIAMPIFMSVNFILDIWLKKYPEESVLFIKLSLINILIDTISGPLMMGLQATGKIKVYQIVVGVLIFLNLPLSYYFVKHTHVPEVIYAISIIVSIFALGFRIYFLSRQIKFNLMDFLKDVIIRIILASICITGVYFTVQRLVVISNDWWLFALRSTFMVIFIGLIFFYILLNVQERNSLKSFFFSKVTSRHNRR